MVVLAAAIIIAQQELTQGQVTWRTLDACDRGPYSPLLTIRAINEVVSLGSKQSGPFLDRYFKHLGLNGHGNLFPFIRCIFLIPRNPGYLPAPKTGAFEPMPPTDMRLAPRFPYALIGDVPIVIASPTGALAGFPEPEAEHYIHLSTMAKLRTTPLVPIDRPWILVGRTTLPDNVNFSYARRGMNADILNLVSTAYRPKPYGTGGYSWYTDTPPGWRAAVAEMERVHMHWDRDRQEYVRGDGSTLPER